MATDDYQNNTTEETNRYVLKGRFKSNSLKFYGLFLIVFTKRGEMDVSHIVVSTYSSTYDLDSHSPWEKYEELILKLKWDNECNPSMTSYLQDTIEDMTNIDNIQNQFYDYIKNYDYDNIDISMTEIINRIIHDKNLILETGIQEVTEEEFQKRRQTEFTSTNTSNKANEGYPGEEGSVILPIQLILAPVSGTPIYELKIGDKIMTKIIPNTDRANYFIDLLDLRVENYIKPVACEIVDIKSEGANNPLELITKIGPGIYGKCTEDERQVKLRMYNPLVDGPQTKKQDIDNLESSQILTVPGQTKKSSYLKGPYIIIGLFLLLVILFIILVYISF